VEWNDCGVLYGRLRLQKETSRA